MKLWFIDSFKSFSSDEGLNADNPFEMKRMDIVIGSNNTSKSRLIKNIYEKATKKNLQIRTPDNYIKLFTEIDLLFQNKLNSSLPKSKKIS